MYSLSEVGSNTQNKGLGHMLFWTGTVEKITIPKLTKGILQNEFSARSVSRFIPSSAVNKERKSPVHLRATCVSSLYEWMLLALNERYWTVCQLQRNSSGMFHHEWNVKKMTKVNVWSTRSSTRGRTVPQFR